MENNKQQSPILIVGAGIIGLSSALQFAKRGLKVTVIDNLKGKKRRYKVGESLLVFSSSFLRSVADLDHHITEECVPKKGVWFTYGMEHQKSFAGTSEWALERTVPKRYTVAFKDPKLYRMQMVDAQIVRPEAEAELYKIVHAHPDITFFDTGRVTKVEINENEKPHQLTWRCSETKETHEMSASWIVDCSGRFRMLARKFDHVAEERVLKDGFQTKAVWGQFSGVTKDMFAHWEHTFQDGGKSNRIESTMHLWGKGYWIWVIQLSKNRISVGVTFDKRITPDEENPQDQFWHFINKYPVLKQVLDKDNLLDFGVYDNVQYLTDTYVSANRYTMLGDAASIIDAYYSQGISHAMVTSWHVTNIIEADIKHNHLDQDYIKRVNRNTMQDWLMVRNMVKQKFTNAIADSRFFFISHLLDLLVFLKIGNKRHQLARWLAETDCKIENEEALHTSFREKLSNNLYYSRSYTWLSPESNQKLQAYFQDKLAARAKWRLENNVQTRTISSLLRLATGPIPITRLLWNKKEKFIDLSPDEIQDEPERFRMTGTEKSLFQVSFITVVMTITFFIMYFLDGLTTRWYKVRKALGKKYEASEKEIVMPRVPVKTEMETSKE